MEQLANNAVTTLNGAINNSVTSIVITSATNFPSSGNYRVICESEIMLVTAISGTTLTVVRGYEGTTAASHVDLSIIGVILTKGSIQQYLSDYGISTLCLPDRKPASPGTYDEEFEGTQDTLPTNWAWTSAPSGSDGFTINSRWPSLFTLEGTGNTSYTLTRSSFSPGSGDFGIWWKVMGGPVTADEICNVRLYAFNSGLTEGRGWELHASNTVHGYEQRTLKTISSVESVWGGGVGLVPSICQMYGGLTRTSGNSWTAWYSQNGIAWHRHGAAESHSFTVDKFVLTLRTTSIQSLTGIDWIRYRGDLLFPRP